MDILNLAILRCLQDNARRSNASIAREVGISPPAVAERIRKLEDEGAIAGYKTIVDPLALGFQFRALITIRAFMGKLKPFLVDVKEWREVIHCYRVTGNENIVMEVVLKDQKHLESFVDKVIQYGESKTQIVLSQVVAYNPVKN